MTGLGWVRRCGLGLAVATATLAIATGSANATTHGPLNVSTAPGLYPGFATSISDYVIRSCPSTGVEVDVTTPQSTFVSVDNQRARTGTFKTKVHVTSGQEFTIVAKQGGTATATWYARCLPGDFPKFASSVSGSPQAQYYLTAALAAPSSYLVMFDDNGVPVWWSPVPWEAIFAQDQPNGNIAWTNSSQGPVHIRNLSGQSQGTVSTPDGPIDVHEFQTLPNGDSLVIVDEQKCCTDLSSWGSAFPSSATIADQVVEEINSSNQVVWSWDALAHINPVVETAPQWRSAKTGTDYDVFHMNSADYRNGHILLSFRHLNAIYDINQSNKTILWKIGGHQDPQSLTVENDPVFTGGGTLCGQHDARSLTDGTVTVHDNGTGCNRPPRAVHYSIDTTNKTATLLQSITDSRVQSSGCCGSARLLPGGDWVMAWGQSPDITELTSAGTPVYTVTWTDSGVFSYRVLPINPGFYSAQQLRTGMNAQYPR